MPSPTAGKAPHIAENRQQSRWSLLIGTAVITVVCLSGGSVSAKDIYVSTEGSDTNAGTSAKPYRTIQKGINNAAAGDTVYVRALTSAKAQAVYVERLSFNAKSGTAAAPITLCGDPLDGGALPAVDQSGVSPAADDSLTALLTIVNSSYVTVRGLEFRNFVTTSAHAIPCGIHLDGGGTGVKILGNKVHHVYQNSTSEDASGFGLVAYGSTTTPMDKLLIDGNEIYDLRTGGSESFTLNGNVTNFTVSHNKVHDGNNIGMDFIGFEQSLTDTLDYARNGGVSDNLIYNIDSQYNPAYGGSFGGVSGRTARDNVRGAAGLYIDGGSSIVMERNEVAYCNYGIEVASEHAGKVAANCVVRDNLVHHNHVGGLTLGGAGSGNGSTQNCTVSNNTFYQNDTENWGGGSVQIQHHVTSTTIKQNIFVCAAGSVQFVCVDSSDDSFPAGTIDYNLYSGTTESKVDFLWLGSDKGTFTSWKSASAQDAHSQFITSSSGLFVKPSPAVAADFALAATSPAKDKGKAGFTAAAGELDFFSQPRVSGAVDIGMAEFGSQGPLLELDAPEGTALVSGGVAGFGTAAVGGNVVKTFTVKNLGNGSLTGLTFITDGANAADFAEGGLSSAPPVAPGGSVTFNVTFAPAAQGTRTATLHLISNDPAVPRFNLVLSGVAVLPPSITTQPLPHEVNPGAKVTFTVAATGAGPLSYQWRKDGENLAGATGTSFSIAKAAESNEGVYDVVVTNPAAAVTSNAASLLVNDPVSISAQPASVSAALGSSTTLAAGIAGTGPLTYQWRKNGVNIAGATSASLQIPNVQFATAGSYSVVVKNSFSSMTSASAVVTVADAAVKTSKLPPGSHVTFTANVSGPVISFTWAKNAGPLPADARFVARNNVLTISNLKAIPDDSGLYTCTAHMPGGDFACRFVLEVYSKKPEITLPAAAPHLLVMPDAIVGGTYVGFDIPCSSDPAKTPASFSATGLPPGLKVDAATGHISGKPAVANLANRAYTVTLGATNAMGTSTARASLLLKPLPYADAGLFSGPVAREPSLNQGLGGRADLAISVAGIFTGKVTLGATAYSVTGGLEVDVKGVAMPHGVARITRPAPALPLTVSFDLDATNHLLINGDVTDGTVHAAFNGWRKNWGTTMTAAQAAGMNTYLGYYTFGLDIPAAVDGLDVIPQGVGTGAFTVAPKTGLVAVTGRLADGVAFACSTFAGPHGEVLVYEPLYAARGSLLGSLDIAQGTANFAPPYGNNTLAGSLTWLKPAAVSGMTRTYNSGFGPMNLTAFGARYLAPSAHAVVMGLASDGVHANASLSFTQGGINDTWLDPGIDVRIQPGGVVVGYGENFRATTLAVAPSTGAISGSFKLIDVNLFAPTGYVARSADFHGFIINDAGEQRGYGFFLLPGLPKSSTQTPATTPVLSGAVVLQKK